jgi:hypothetical protein
MLRMLLRPAANRREAGDEGVAGAALVDIHDVHHFEAGLVHLVLRIEAGIGRKSRFCNFADDGWMRVAATLLNLTDASGQLIGQGSMSIIERAHRLRVLLDELAFAGGDARVVAVMTPDHLNLIDTQRSILLGDSIAVRVRSVEARS